MNLARRISVVTVLVIFGGSLLALQSNGYQFYGSGPYDPVTPEQSREKAEFSWSRLQYTAAQRSMGGFGQGFGGYGGYGYGGRFTWGQDYPKADRQFLLALRRLTRVSARSTEQVVNLDDDKIFNYPWVYAVDVQDWTFTPPEAKRLHDYLLKGGFLMVDNFHGTADWENFMNGMRLVIPDRPVEDLSNSDEIFHVLYDLSDRFQVPGEQYVQPAGHMRRMATCRSGGPFATIKDA